MNKIPLVRWSKKYTYISSTHSLLPRGLNLVYDEAGGEKATGVLLHMKFLGTLVDKTAEETKRQEHYAQGAEYQAYQKMLKEHPVLWNAQSVRYKDWRQLEDLGIMSRGNWA